MYSDQRSNKTFFWKSLLITAIPVLLFHGIILGNDLIWDDFHLIIGHPEIDTPGFFLRCFLRDYGLEFGSRQPAGYYRPLFMAMITLIYKVGGTSPILYRLLSLGTLTLIGWLSSLFLYRITKSELALWTGAVVACHPLYSTTVCFLANWPDLALGLYGLTAIFCLFLLMKAKTGKKKRIFLLFGLFIITIIVCLTKFSGTFTMGGLMVGSLAFGKRKWRRIALFWMAAGLGILTVLSIRSLVGISQPINASGAATVFYPLLPEYSADILWAMGLSVRQLFIPHDSPHCYAYTDFIQDPNNLPGWVVFTQSGVALAILTVAAILFILIYKRRPLYSLLLAWATMGSWSMPMSLSLMMQYSERYLAVTPAVLLFCLLGIKLIQILRKKVKGQWDSWLTIGFCFYLVLFGAFTFKSSVRPMNTRSFWTLTLETQPTSLHAHICLGFGYLAENNLEKAEYHAIAAIKLDPINAQKGRVGIILGTKAIMENNGLEALRWYSWTLKALPENAVALQGKAIALSMLGEFAQARETILYAINKSPYTMSLYRDGARIVASSTDLTPNEAAEIIKPWIKITPEINENWTTPQGIEQYRLERSKPSKDQE
jgi:tetratricopeptide (TPR) repeat protein